jgi:hypothetical protein
VSPENVVDLFFTLMMVRDVGAGGGKVHDEQAHHLAGHGLHVGGVGQHEQ